MSIDRLPMRLLIATVTLLFIPASCFAWQSGSSGSTAPSAPSSGFGSAPSQSFSTPFSQPTFNQPSTVQPFNQPSFQSFPNQSFPNQPGAINFDQPSVIQSQGQFQNGSGTVNGSMPSTQQPSSSGSSGSLGIPSSSLVDPIFQINNPGSPIVVNHSTWDWFLSRYLVTDRQGLNRIRYGNVSCQDRNVLQGYLNQLQSTDIRALNRNEQLAYWFNLYNARTVALVVDNYPLRSVRQIKQKFTDFVGPFDDEGAVNVLGKSLSLNDIESGIVRPVWNDPRIHYALNCASYGCPNLAPTAWRGHDVDARLNGAAYEYINSGRAVKSGLRGPRLSKIYKWYKADFGDNDQAVLNHVRQYANQNTCRTLGNQQSIAGYHYDWSLNDGRKLRPRILEALRR